MVSQALKYRKVLKRGKRWILLGTALAVTAVIAILFYNLTRSYVLEQAERRVRDVMLECRAFHHYVQRNMHPALYQLKKDDRVPEEFYAPELLSSSYIARNLHKYYNEERKKAGLPEIQYKLAATNPRNSVNQANSFEQSIIEMFNTDKTRTQYRDIIKVNGRKYLYYATPFLKVEQRCLKCHGEPEAAPKELRDYYKWTGGYGLKNWRHRSN